MVEVSPDGVLRVSLTSGLAFWVEGRTLACTIYHMCYARTWGACCRSWPRPDSGCLWEVACGDLMLEASCGGRLWHWYCLCWVSVPGLRVCINIGGGVECFIEVGIKETINVGVVRTFWDNSSVRLFNGWKVDEG
eukprot:352721-Pelagomonas_calceolata.AAC.2